MANLELPSATAGAALVPPGALSLFYNKKTSELRCRHAPVQSLYHGLEMRGRMFKKRSVPFTEPVQLPSFNFNKTVFRAGPVTET